MARKLRSARRAASQVRGELAMKISGVVIGLAAIAGFAGMFYFKTSSEKPVVRDQTTLCPVTGPSAVRVVLLDATDDLPGATRKEISTRLMDEVTAAAANELVEIRLLDPAADGGRVVFSRCNPGDGAGLSEWTANPTLARKKWLESFQKPVQQALQDGMRPSQAAASPLLRTLQAIAIERFTGQDAALRSKRLIVLSDLIEHGPKYSQYGGKLRYEDFRKLDFYKDVRTNLNRADVTFYHVQRRTRVPLPSMALIQFWIDWVSDNNGQFKEALKLQGLG